MAYYFPEPAFSPCLGDFTHLTVPELGDYLQDALKHKQSPLVEALQREVKKRGVSVPKKVIPRTYGKDSRKSTIRVSYCV